MRLIFMGTPDFAVPTLKALIASTHDVVAAYSQPPRPAGRGKKLQKSPVHQCAEQAGIPVETPLNFKSDEAVETYKAYGADLAVVAAYGLILPLSILEAPRRGCLNIHASILPRWRGAAPIHRAIQAGDAETGVALMQMEQGLDTGPVHALSTLAITPDMTTGDLHDFLADEGASLLSQYLDAVLNGETTPQPQAENGVTYAHKIEKEEAVIDWSKPVDQVDRHVRAMNPFPGAFTHQGADRLRVHEGSCIAEDHQQPPGTVLDDKGLIACGTGAYQLQKVQRAGKAAADIDAFLRGYTLSPGAVLTGSPSDTVSD